MSNQAKHYRICGYVRVSTEEQCESPEGSIKNQEERIKQAVRHKLESGASVELVEVYVDAGLSAKDMKRPALQRMLNSIKRKEVNLVIVTELSRLSRNTKDFCEMWEFLEVNSCEFHSLREHFDTTSAAGVLMLKSMANFAEFERKQTAERIAASFKARAERGLYNGGPVAFGYRPTKDQTGRLLVVEEDAVIIRAAFQAFLDNESLSTASKWLNKNGFKLRKQMNNGGSVRLGHFMVDTLHHILTNKSYIGVRVFKTKEGKKESKAVWDAIVDEGTFGKVQEKLARNLSKKKPHSPQRYPYILSGIISCGVCGDTLCGKSAHGRNKKYPFYEHSRVTKTQGTLKNQPYQCRPHRFPGEIVQTKVWEAVEELLRNPLIAHEIIAQAKLEHAKVDYSQEEEKLKNKVYQLQGRMNALTERLSELPVEMDAGPIYQQMQKIAESKKELEVKIVSVKKQNLNFEMPVELSDYQKFLEMLQRDVLKAVSPQLKQKILCKLVEKVELLPEGMRIHFVVSASKIKRELDKTGSLLLNAIRCSNSLTNGGPSRGIGEHQIAHDFIELSSRTPSRIIEKCAPLYEKGLSLRDIEERTRIPKTTIRETLTRNGFALRNPLSCNAKKIDNKSTKRGGSTPFGYAYLDGKLLMDPKEQIALRKIQKLHQKGKSYQAIADELNNKKIPTRSGKPWIRSVVRSIMLKTKGK